MSNSINILYNQQAREHLVSGISSVAKAVKSTLGPNGKNVIIYKIGKPTPDITKDGVTVAKNISSHIPEIDAGMSLIKSVAQKTAHEAGDGTTTATVLAEAIILEGIKYLLAGHNAHDLNRGIQIACVELIESIKKFVYPSKSYEMIKSVATISTNNDEFLGTLIAECVKQIGPHGVVSVEDGTNSESKAIYTKGMKVNRGFISKHFITDYERKRVVFDNPLIFIADQKIERYSVIQDAMKAAKDENRPIVFIGEDVVGEALAYLQVNSVNNTVKCAAIKAPSFGEARIEYLNNIAIFTGAAVISGLKNNDEDSWLGGAKKIIITDKETIIYGGAGNPQAIKNHVNALKKSMANAKIDHDKELYKNLIAGLTGSIATIIIGGNSEVEIKEKRDRVDDALHAVYAAIQEGVIPGGGIALYRAASELSSKVLPMLSDSAVKNSNLSPSTLVGRKILLDAALVPFKTIMNNCELNSDLIMSNIMNDELNNIRSGYNAKTMEYTDMIETGIVDPFFVTRNALTNAASIAGIILTTDCLICEKNEPSAALTGTSPFLPGMM